MLTAEPDDCRPLREHRDVPIDFMTPNSNGHDDLRGVASLPHLVRGLQGEVTAIVNECIHELDAVCELLRGFEMSLVRNDAQQPMRGPSAAGQYEPTAMSMKSAFQENPAQGDFDARLANLKRMLAEKLIDQEPTKT